MSYREDPSDGDPGGRENLHLPATGAGDAVGDAVRSARRKARHTAKRLAARPLDWQLSVPGHGSWLGEIDARRLDGDAVERLARLRRILPLLAEELARARRDAAAMRLENRRLLERLQELERDLALDAARANAALQRPAGGAWPPD